MALAIEGLTKEGESNFDAVFVTHYHGDHIGMFNKVLKEIYQILERRLVKANIATK